MHCVFRLLVKYSFIVGGCCVGWGVGGGGGGELVDMWRCVGVQRFI